MRARAILCILLACVAAALPAQPETTAPPQGSRGVVVLDAAHGGADAGARGRAGVLEKDVVLALARAVRAELEPRGWRVVETRSGDDNPSFDDRAATANAYRDAVFLTLHVASTGRVGTARAFSMSGLGPAASAPRGALLRWDRAQEPYLSASRQLAGRVQAELARRFPGSPDAPGEGAVRQLRSVAAPAVAIELASVSVRAREEVERFGPALGEAIALALEAGAR